MGSRAGGCSELNRSSHTSQRFSFGGKGVAGV